MKKGDLVQVRGEKRLYVALPVTRRDIARGVNANMPGLHLFGGFWYRGPALSIRAYGKILTSQGRIVGRIRGRLAAMKHCR